LCAYQQKVNSTTYSSKFDIVAVYDAIEQHNKATAVRWKKGMKGRNAMVVRG